MTHSIAYKQFLSAANYLIAAEHSFINNESSFIFPWDEPCHGFITKPLTEEGMKLCLNAEFYSIDVLHPELGEIASYPLTNARHLDICNWLDRERQLFGIEEAYQFDKLHLNWDDERRFEAISVDIQDAHFQLIRTLQSAIQSIAPAFDAFSGLGINPEKVKIQGEFQINSKGKKRNGKCSIKVEGAGVSVKIKLEDPDFSPQVFSASIDGLLANSNPLDTYFKNQVSAMV